MNRGKKRSSGSRAGKSFREIVAAARQTCDARLFRRAQIASRLAKVARGRPRASLYGVKHRALAQLITAGQPVVRTDRWRCPGLLSVEVPGHGRLHTHERWMETR